MTKLPPYEGIGTADLKDLLDHSNKLSSFGNQRYVDMHKAVIQEIQTQKDRNLKAAQRSLHMTIHSGYTDSIQLQPEIQELINSLQKLAQENLEICANGPYDISEICELAISCLELETQSEPKAEKILIRGEKAQSRKLYNIRFNLKGLISLLDDWLLLGQTDIESAQTLIVILIRSLAKLYDLALIDFDQIQAIILMEWYRKPKENGRIDEEDFIKCLLKDYHDRIPKLTVEKIRKKVDQLVKFHCAEIYEGKLAITETIVIK